MKEFGRVLDLSESRPCRTKLRAKLASVLQICHYGIVIARLGQLAEPQEITWETVWMRGGMEKNPRVLGGRSAFSPASSMHERLKAYC